MKARSKKAKFPLRYALLTASAYGGLTAAWVTFSTAFVSNFSTSVQEMERAETLKGIGYVVVTTVLFFFVAYAVFKKISNDHRALVQSQRRLIQSERDSISGLIASSIAHDFSNLLTMLRLNTERLRTLPQMPDSAADSLTRLDRSVSRLAELAARMQRAGRHVLKDRPKFFDLRETIVETLELLSEHTVLRGCSIRVSAPEGVAARGYPILIHQLVMNLVLNAAEATRGQGRIEIRAERNGEFFKIEVHDDGPGIPAELRGRVFDAFFTTKSFGSGLGLLSVKSCVEMHSGTISIGESELGGALFSVSLPDLDDSRLANLKTSESLNKFSPIGATSALS